MNVCPLYKFYFWWQTGHSEGGTNINIMQNLSVLSWVPSTLTIKKFFSLIKSVSVKKKTVFVVKNACKKNL